jgi:alpha-tubulin suppressor-like RCC1 family protein
MSYRYPNAFIKPGLNTLVNGTPSYTYYLDTWGQNSYGQLGLNNTNDKSSPNQVGSLTDWLQVASTYGHTIAVKTDGTLWTWGLNSTGQLGLGNTTNYSSPKQVGALTTWSYVGTSANSAYGASYAIKVDGTLWSWGSNANGRLGLNNTTSYSSPKQVGALTNWLKVTSAGYTNSVMAIKTDGTMWAWGRNQSGQLGIGNTTYYSSPMQVGALTNWANVSIGINYGMAIKTDGTLWAWGNNNYGQQGTGNTSNRNSPIQVGALTTWSKISCGSGGNGSFCQSIRTDGTLWAWGWNREGELGLNITNYYATISSPQQVGSLTTWSKVACGQIHSIATKTDGTLWSWGGNNYGQLGTGNNTTRSSPVLVGALTTWSTPSAGNYSSFVLAY